MKIVVVFVILYFILDHYFPRIGWPTFSMVLQKEFGLVQLILMAGYGWTNLILFTPIGLLVCLLVHMVTMWVWYWDFLCYYNLCEKRQEKIISVSKLRPWFILQKIQMTITHYHLQGCGEMRINEDDNGMWFEEDCFTVKEYVCYKPPSTSNPVPSPPAPVIDCPDGYVGDPYHNTCVKLMDGMMSWDDAKAACRKEGTFISYEASIGKL